MKLKVGHIYDATQVVALIIRDQSGQPRPDGSLRPRPMPQKGKYRLARMHAQLFSEFKTIDAQREALIKAYDWHPKVKAKDQAGKDTDVDSDVDSDMFGVPEDKQSEFIDAWNKLRDEEIEVEVQQLPLDQIDMGGAADGALDANELIILGDLVKE